VSDKRSSKNPDPANEFERQATRRSGGVLGDFVDFLRYNRKWWLVPILMVLLLAGLVAILGGTAIAPFIYTLF
jgi:hypothetical protein